MKKEDFWIGLEFYTATGKWRCTDIGTRVIVAIKLDQDDPRNYNGPPYSIVEHVFDEYDIEGCILSPDDFSDDDEETTPELFNALLEDRAKRGSWEKAVEVLKKVPDVEPEEYNRL